MPALLLAGTAQAGAKEERSALQMKMLQHVEAKLEREVRQLRRSPVTRTAPRAQSMAAGPVRTSRGRQAAISNPQKAAGAEELLRQRKEQEREKMMQAIMRRQSDSDASVLNPQQRAKLLRQKKEKLQGVKAARAKLKARAAGQDAPVASLMTAAQVGEETGSISGSMTNATGNGLAGWVDVYDLDYNWAGSTSTAADGSYTVSGLNAGSYKVAFYADGNYISEWYNDKASFESADAVAVTSGGAVSGINAELAVGGSISGKMTDAAGNGLAGWVYVLDLDYNWAGDAITAADGSYTVIGLRAGSYKVLFYADGNYTSEWYNDKASFESADAVAVTSGGAVSGINAELAVGGSISGKMTDAAGNGLVGGVDVYDLDYNWAGDAITAADGSYTVIGLRAGSYKVLFYADGNYTSEWYNDKASFESADAVAVTSGGAVSGINAELGVGGSISGKMTDAAGNGLVGGVDVYDLDYNWAGYTWTAADGSYTVIGLRAGSYKVLLYADDESYNREWYNDKASFETADVVAVTDGNTTSGINAVLEAGGSISGKMTNAAGTGLAGWVHVYDSLYEWAGDVRTAADGSYTVSGLNAGSYKVAFYADGNYISEWYNDKASFESADAVVVTLANTTANVNAVLEVSGSISGKMTNAAGTGLAGYVAVYDSSNEWVGDAQTEADGSYVVSGLSAGSYKVNFDADDQSYLDEWYNNKASFNAADAVAVTLGSTTANINAVLELGGSISGRMTDAAGTGLVGWVDVYDLNYNWTGYDARTAVDGSYTVSGLKAGSYKVLFYADDKRFISQWYSGSSSFGCANEVAVTLANTTANVNAVLEVGGSISGRMTDAAGTGLAGRVHVYDLDYNRTGYAWTAADGSYTVSGLNAGSYKVKFDADDQSYLDEWYNNKASFNAADTVAVILGSTVANINAALEVGGSISGRMTNAAGTGLSGWVDVYDLDYNRTGYAWTAADGSYTISGLRAGSYKVKFYADDESYAYDWYNNKDSFNAADTVAVTLGSTTANINAILELGGSISGRMIDAAGTGLAGWVDVYDLDYNWAGDARTAADGSYTVSGLRAGSYKVKFYADDESYAYEWYNNKASFNAADTVAVTLGSTVANINAALEVGGSISGKMTNAAGTGLSGWVAVYDSSYEWVEYAETAEDGSYTVSGLRTGSYKVQFMPYSGDIWSCGDSKPYVAEWYNNKRSFYVANPVQVTAPNVTTGIDAKVSTETKVLLPILNLVL
ncbi:MAG: MSCRAMM family protein [Candidatus Electronema sp. VV]